MDHSVSIKRPITSFRSGGHVSKRSRFMENGIKSMDAKVESQLNKTDKVKAMAQTPDLDIREADPVNAGIAAHRRKSNDSPAVVPIKKRRIQLLEATRSPSPPPSSPSPRATSPHSIPPAVVPLPGDIGMPISSSSTLLGFSSASSPRSSMPIPISASISQGCLPPSSHMQPLAHGADNTKVTEKAEDAHVDKVDTKEHPIETMEGNCDNENNNSSLQDSLEDPNGQVSKDAAIDEIHSPVKADGDLVWSESGSCNRDDRLHWDLNTHMEAWDASTEQGTEKITEIKDAGAAPARLPSVDAAGTTHDYRNVGCGMDAGEQLEEASDNGEEEPEDKKESADEDPDILEEVLEEPEIVEQDVEDIEIGEHIVEEPEMEDQMEEEPESKEQNKLGNSDHRDTEKEEATSPSLRLESEWNATDAADFPDSGKPASGDADLSSDGRDGNELSEALCHQDDVPERPKPGKQGRSSSEDAEEWNYEPELEEHVDYGDSDCRDADDPLMDLDERTSSMQVESNWKEEDGMRSQKVTPCDGEASAAGEIIKCTLPNAGQPSSEPSPERHTPSGRSRTTGWDQLPEGFDSAEEALRAAKDGSARRGGRGGSWSTSSGRGSLHTASRFGPPGSNTRSNTRDGFSTARGDSYYGDRHPDESLYDRDGYRHGRRVDDSYNARGREPARRPGIFGRGRGAGWMDSQPGHMNQWGPGRHRPGSGFNGPSNTGVTTARVDNGGFGGAPDGTMTKHGMGPGRGGIRSTVSGGRVGRGGHVRGPPVDMDGGVHYPLRAGSGAERVASLGTGAGPGYTGSMHDRGGRGMMDRYRGGGMESRRSLSPRRPHPLDHPNMMGRMPGMRPDSRVVRSRTPPASHRSGGPSEFPGVRNQRSPPPSSRWSSDKREADSFQERDFKRPMSRTRAPSQRTVPHVIHGSSLTDERDRQVLAGSRHSPPLKSSVAPAHLRKSKDDTLDSRPSKRTEEDDARHAGSFAKDGEYRRTSPPRESERERERGSLYRRERDRDDERRRDSRRSSSRDGRFPGGPKYPSTREVDDDVAPRRRRPS